MSIRTTTTPPDALRASTVTRPPTEGGAAPAGLLQVIRYRYWYFAFSLAIIIPGLIFLLLGGLRPGIDFTGGTELSVHFATHPKTALTEAGIKDVLRVMGLRQIEVQQDLTGGRNAYIIRTEDLSSRPTLVQAIDRNLRAKYGIRSLNSDSVSGTIGQEIQTRATIAVIVASLVILGYITLAFRKMPHPFRYGVCAIVALLHDVLVVLGLFAILGKLFGVTIDALFITALLTVIGFSVHDTIVVFDRIRENLSRRTGEAFPGVVNNAILQTLARSLNTSITVLLTLLAMLLFGGETIRIFVLTLLIGITSGTYSSIFNASQLLVVWETGELGRFFGRRRGGPGGGPGALAARA